MKSARPTHRQPMSPSRRNLLRGGVALGVAAAATAAGTMPAAALPRDLFGKNDYPDAEWIPADGSNFDVGNRPTDYPVEFVVIHVTQGAFDGAIQHFQNPDSNVSAHYVVRSLDGHVVQMVHDKDIAWHAGNYDYNTRSIGIEHEGFVDDPAWFTEAMYVSSAELTAAMCDTYGIPKDRAHIIGHHEVPGADHTDPGDNWDWDHYIQLVNS